MHGHCREVSNGSQKEIPLVACQDSLAEHNHQWCAHAHDACRANVEDGQKRHTRAQRRDAAQTRLVRPAELVRCVCCGSPTCRLQEAVRQRALAVVHVRNNAEVANGLFIVRAQVHRPISSPLGAPCGRPARVQRAPGAEDHRTAATDYGHFAAIPLYYIATTIGSMLQYRLRFIVIICADGWGFL